MAFYARTRANSHIEAQFTPTTCKKTHRVLARQHLKRQIYHKFYVPQQKSGEIASELNQLVSAAYVPNPLDLLDRAWRRRIILPS